MYRELLSAFGALAFSAATSSAQPVDPAQPLTLPPPLPPSQTVTIGPAVFEVRGALFDSFDALPAALETTRGPVTAFARPEGDTHYYEAVHVPGRNISWVQAARLAQSEGGYLATLTSADENAAVFALIDAPRFFAMDPATGWTAGPYLGALRPEGVAAWQWISGESWAYAPWITDPDDDRLPGGQRRVAIYAVSDSPAPTWAGTFGEVSHYDMTGLPMDQAPGFVIEYDSDPRRD